MKNKLLSRFRNKKIIVTGHTGFKGSWLAFWLTLLGAKVYGISLKPKSSNLFFNILGLNKKIHRSIVVDIRKFLILQKTIYKIQPDFIFHLAAQAIVKDSYTFPIQTWETNLLGTINILESCKIINKKCILVIITSDKCYKNLEKKDGYKETDELGGKDPYSASKAAAELAIHSYYSSYFSNNKKSYIRIASARAGNVIGGGDWSEGRIIPDCIKAWIKQKKVFIRNKNSVRPWQHVFDALYGYLLLSLNLEKDKKISGNSFNFGPELNKKFTVKKLTYDLSKLWKLNIIPFKFINKNKFYETKVLQLDTSKARKILKWKNYLSIKESIKVTSEWYYHCFQIKDNIYSFSLKQIKNYQKLLKN